MGFSPGGDWGSQLRAATRVEIGVVLCEHVRLEVAESAQWLSRQHAATILAWGMRIAVQIGPSQPLCKCEIFDDSIF